ncbi:MAG: lysophospholipid acyltransferase family protein [Phycisphaeraceae bacterium]|nr:lysophospholipid acyltransferase family protein [Phycisphaerae bacterium]MBX3391972.1 lysophospholipid acyltransferase family protein [Phycisphaeraceae bacterium]HRJ49008.1 lysophospholipid acyltransferase family protein [Phycisphaerales bacterium]
MGKRKEKIPRWLHWPVTAIIRSGMAVPVIAGFDTSTRTARGIAKTYCGMPFNRRRLLRAMEHIEQAFPGMDAPARRRMVEASYAHLFTLGVELAFTPRCLTTDAWASHVEVGPVADALDAMLGDGPAILLTGHCGNWEVLGYTLALLGFRLHALYRPLDLRPLDAWVRRTRQACGLTLVDKFGAADLLPEILGQGRPVGFVADQNAGDRGLFVPFFGRLASTYKTIGLLAMQFQAPVVCGMARRIDENSFRYRLEIQDVIRPGEWRDTPDPLFYLTARYRRAIERAVVAAPSQYLWMHRIWKSRPRHERLGRPFPDSLREKLRSLPWMTDDELARIIDLSARDAAALAAN